MAAPASANPPAGGPERFLRTDHLKDDLRGRSVRGGAVTVAGQSAKHLMGVVALAFLARLLTPADFGLLAMVAGFTNFFVQFKDLGLSMATVQRKEITHQQVSTLFWVNVGVGLVATALTVGLAPILAWFYGEPSLTAITLALAVMFVFGGLTVQHQALLRRRMRFTALATLQVVSGAVGMVAGVVAAWLGAGYWALVVVQLTVAVADAAGVWIACGWRPGWPARGAGVRSLLTFGGNLTAANFLNYLTRNLDKILIGRVWGEVAAGLYFNAYKLLLLPLRQFNTPLTSVAIPALSRLQDKPSQYRAYYQKALQLLAMLAMPVVVFTFVCAEEVVLLILGEQWRGAAPIFRMLAPAAWVGTFNVATGWVYVSLGRTHRQLRWAVVGSTALTLGFVFGLPWGPVGVAAACSIVSCAIRLPAIAYCFYATPLEVKHLVESIWRPTLTSFAAGAALFVAGWYLPGTVHVTLDVLLALVTYAVFYLIAWVVVPGGLTAVREVRTLAGDLWPQPSDRDV